MGKVKTVPISGVKLIIYPPMLFYLFSITCLVTYRMGLQLHPSKKKKKKTMCKGTISAVYQSKCASATMSQISI